MTKTTSGIDAFHANIERMKQLGRDNQAQREQEARQNTVEHLQTMEQRATAAALLKERKRLDNNIKGKSLRALAA
jgi:hypothetical protein